VTAGAALGIAKSDALWYAYVMHSKRVTVSVPEATAKRLKKASKGKSVSSWVTEVIEEKLNTLQLEEQWRAIYAEVKPRGEDIKKADVLFDALLKVGRRRAA
jgi:hypothetical protein